MEKIDVQVNNAGDSISWTGVYEHEWWVEYMHHLQRLIIKFSILWIQYSILYGASILRVESVCNSLDSITSLEFYFFFYFRNYSAIFYFYYIV